MPGLIAQQLYGDKLAKADEAFPTLVRDLIHPGVRGFIYAAIAGAVTSTLASILNSASTIATMDVYQRLLNRNASQTQLVWLGRVLTVLFVVGGCLLAPQLDDPKFGGVFQFIQQFQGYIWPGVVAVFLFGMLVETAPVLRPWLRCWRARDLSPVPKVCPGGSLPAPSHADVQPRAGIDGDHHVAFSRPAQGAAGAGGYLPQDRRRR